MSRLSNSPLRDEIIGYDKGRYHERLLEFGTAESNDLVSDQ